MKPVEQLLFDLVGIPSVSSMDNRPVIDYVIGCLDPNLWEIRLDSYVDSAGATKTNLVALTIDAIEARVELALVCHSDTVPYDANWSEAVNPAIREGRLYGRGSCDVKSFLACALAALGDLRLDDLRKPLGLIVTADEEVGCVGAKRLAAQNAFSTNYMIIGEPTGLHPVRAGKGYALATVTVRGKEAHSAFPARGRSAIVDAARVVLALENVAAKLESLRDPAFEPPFTTLNVGTIQGGTAKNIVPGECRLLIEWRPIPGHPTDHVVDLINEELGALRQSDPAFNVEFDVQRMDPPFAPSNTEQLAGMLTALTQKTSATIAFGSEAAHLAKLSNETVVFGPGDMTLAHRTGESIALVELQSCTEYLKVMIERLCISCCDQHKPHNY